MRILMMEGNPATVRESGRGLGVASPSQVYLRAIADHFPQIEVDVVNAADPGPWLPENRSFRDYAGLVVGGSSLHAYGSDFTVTNQIEMLRSACEEGLPVLGSCWGLQIAVVAAGGQVEPSPNGREIGFARKIVKTDAGRDHPFLMGKPDCFDALCIHYDSVTSLPEGVTVLASNGHSEVQAAIVPLARSQVWSVQYHPEFDLHHIDDLFRLYATSLVTEGFFANEQEVEVYRGRLRALARDPDATDLAWQLGVDEDILDPQVRNAEIVNWVREWVLPASAEVQPETRVQAG